MLVCLFFGPSDYLKGNERICIKEHLDFGDDPDYDLIVLTYTKLLPEVCLEPRTNPLNFVDDPNYNPDSGSGLRLF